MSGYTELLAALPNHDVEMMRLWISSYAFREDSNRRDFAPIDTLMLPWASAKSSPIYEDKSLWDLMEHQLILKREFEYAPNTDEYVDRLTNELLYQTGPMHDFYIVFTERLYKKWCMDKNGSILSLSRISSMDYYYVVSLFTEPLANNKVYNLPTYNGADSNLAPLKIKMGEKTTRVIKKIVNAYTPDLLPLYEAFLLQYSQVFQLNISVKGTLCLSIHPLDYMTMSDNASDWNSCMNWVKRGGYRSGTIEMMNSPYVLEAYLESQHPMRKTIDGLDFEWNNKKWRCLYVFNKTALAEIREYPYQNVEISLTAFKWILELAKKNLGWTHLPMQYYDAECLSPVWEGYYLEYETRQMYNDFRFCNHKLCLHEPLTEDIYINYSGVMECMHCGKTWESEVLNNEDPEDDLDFGLLECYDCLDTVLCSHCGRWVPTYLSECIDDEFLCSSCLAEFTTQCTNDGNRHLISNCMNVNMTHNNSVILWNWGSFFYTEDLKHNNFDLYNRIIDYTKQFRMDNPNTIDTYFVDYESLSDEELCLFAPWYNDNSNMTLRERIDAEIKHLLTF